jgi:hypothetical protein
MSNQIFADLLHLYSRHTTNTPTEDFTTEALAGVLRSDQVLLDAYVNEVLAVPGSHFQVETQRRYDGSIVDMVFINAQSICFVENKVDSPEGHKQLQKYAQILADQTERTPHLRYCTKYKDQKTEQDYQPLTANDFLQFRWLNIYNFLRDYPSNPLIEAFLTFLETYEMSSIPDFNYEDLIVMREMRNTIQQMSEVLEAVKPRFTELFGPPYRRDYASLKQIPEENRYAMWKEALLSGSGASEILFAFNFNPEFDMLPVLYVHCYCDKEHPHYSAFKQALNNSGLIDLFSEEDESGYWGWFEKPLSDFLSSANQFNDITNWFIDRLDSLAAFMQKDTLVEWNLPTTNIL